MRVAALGFEQPFPGAVAGPAIDNHHFGCGRLLRQEAGDHAANVLRLVEDCDHYADGLHEASIKAGAGIGVRGSGSERAVGALVVSPALQRGVGSSELQNGVP